MRYIHVGFHQPKRNLIFREAEKPGPDSIGLVAIFQGCTGIAARACGLVGLEPTRVVEILKVLSVPEVFRPIYEPSTVLAEKTTMADNGGVTISPEHDESYDPSQRIISHGGVSEVQSTKTMMIF